MDKLILVTGATGYIASKLIPRLLTAGYRVRALARNPRRLTGRSWFNQVDIAQADVTNPLTLQHALDGVHTAYYLIHHMSYGPGYTRLDVLSAGVFASAADKAGVEHIIYLGGLADSDQDIAPHMRSRIETGKVLREGSVPVTEFRAGVITGSGSISFEMIRFMTEWCRVIPGPAWMKNKTQPIAVENVVDYLLAALESPSDCEGVFEIGGPDVTAYGDLMTRYAAARGLKRKMLLFPGIPVSLMAFGVRLMTPVPYRIAYALIGGLSTDSIVKHPKALTVFPNVKLIDIDVATKDALAKTHPKFIEHVWDDGNWGTRSIKHEGCFILHSDRLLSGQRVADRGPNRCAGANYERQHLMARQHYHNKFREMWVEKNLDQGHITETVFFLPRGPLGFVYWYLSFPFHLAMVYWQMHRMAKTR